MKSGDQRLELTNLSDTVYTAKLYMGTGREPLNVVWDTGLDWTFIETNECTKCSSTYNTASSISFSKIGSNTATSYQGLNVAGF